VYVWKAQVVDIFNKYHDLTGHVSLIKWKINLLKRTSKEVRFSFL
jgi:hypothetical protein